MKQYSKIETLELSNEQATLDLATTLSKRIRPGDILFLNGQLGAGKTFFCQALIRAFGFTGNVLSPTYSLVQSYKVPSAKHQIHHFDLYRLSDPEELEFIGIRDYINTKDICLIEWPSKGDKMLPEPDIIIKLDYLRGNPHGRHITLSFAHGWETD